MRIILAESAGFCFGVKRAVETVYEQIKKGGDIYTYGPIIHNEEVVKDLGQKGVKVLQGKEELEALHSGTVIIRSHGVAKEIYDIIEKNGLTCVDATCPFVKRIHEEAKRAAGAGEFVVVIGNAGHPEVEGIIGWAQAGAAVIGLEEEAARFKPPDGKKLCIVSQTTFNYNKFQDMVEIFQKKGYNVYAVNTICNATEERQAQTRQIAKEADAMIVIGGRHSSNTRKLYEICREECARTYFIQTLDNLYLDLPESVEVVGITAGASTPNYIIEEVQNYVRVNF